MEKIINFTETETKVEDSTDFFDLKILTDGTETSTEKYKRDSDGVSVGCFVLLVDNKNMKTEEKSYNIDLLGNPMYQYVARACPTKAVCLEFDESEGTVVGTIKPYLKDTEYSLVLFSDTPLMTKNNILNILDFVKTKDLNVCKLTRGWVFKNEYIKRVSEIYAPTTYYFEEEDFLTAVNYKQLYLISEILKSRITTYHMNNGVYFKDPDNIYIESNVSIGEGTVIEPFVSLTKDTSIGKNVFIGAFSTLKNAKIQDGAKIDKAHIDGGVVMEKATIMANAKILSQTAIMEGAKIAEDCVVSNAIIGKFSMVGRNTIINYLKTEDNVSIGDNCTISGEESRAVILNAGVNVKDMATIMSGVTIKSGTIVNYGEVIKKEGKKNG